MALTGKQARFVSEYLVDFNATQAAIRAGYSADTAYSQGSRLLKNVEVQAAVREKIMSAEEAALRLTDIARGDIAELMDITPSGFTFRLIESDAEGNRKINPKTKLIRKIKQKVTTSLAKNEDGEDKEIIETEIELYSAHEALRDIGRYHGMFTDKTDITSAGQPLAPPVDNERFDRAITTLADAIRKSLPGAGAGQDGDLGSTE